MVQDPGHPRGLEKSISLVLVSAGGEGEAKGRWDRMQSAGMGGGKAACAFNFCSPGFRNVALLGMLLSV